MSDMSADDKVMSARCRLLVSEPFYGVFAVGMVWREDGFAWVENAEARTMGVRILRSGIIECVWYRDFVDGLSVEELMIIVKHELEHVLRLHCVRGLGRHPGVWNVAADMCVNGAKRSPKILVRNINCGVPHANKLVWVPDGWSAGDTAEAYYDKLLKEDGEKIGFGDKYGVGLGDHGLWGSSSLSVEEARQIVNELARRAVTQSAGNVPDHLEEILRDLGRCRVDWRAKLRFCFGRHVGKRRGTYSRRDRRSDQFGSRGWSHRGAGRVSVVVDTSGSISSEILGEFFAEVEELTNRAKISVLLWDCNFQGYFEHYRRGDWNRIKIKGGGGTDMAEPLLWLVDNGLVGDVCVLLTDGFCNYADNLGFPMVTCICDNSGSSPNWGDVVWLNSD